MKFNPSPFPNMSLKSHHIDALQVICDRGAVPSIEFDARNLRPLRRLDLIIEAHGVVRPTTAGRDALGRASAGPADRVLAPTGKLSEAQEEVLRYLLRQTGPVPADHMDGRVLRALSARGLLVESRGWVSAGEQAEAELRKHTRAMRGPRRRGPASSSRSARAKAIWHAVDELEKTLPKDAEVTVGGHPAYADDVLAGLRRLAREMN